MKPLFVPGNLNMRQFGHDARKIAQILDYIYRAEMYRDQYGCLKKKKCNFHKPVTINIATLKKVLHDNPRKYMEKICRLGSLSNTLIEEVIIRVKKPNQFKHQSGRYLFAKPYRVKPVHLHLPRLETANFRKREREIMKQMVASFPENYRNVCQHIQKLTLEINEAQQEELIQQIRNEYIQRVKEEYIQWECTSLAKDYPKMNQYELQGWGEMIWEESDSKKCIKELDEENYDRILFIRDKFLEMRHEDEFPVYSKDAQGRLHYYLTNMSEELRPYVRMDGKKLVSYDLGTSQCVFIWLNGESPKKCVLLVDSTKYKSETILNLFYEAISWLPEEKRWDVPFSTFATVKHKAFGWQWVAIDPKDEDAKSYFVKNDRILISFSLFLIMKKPIRS